MASIIGSIFRGSSLFGGAKYLIKASDNTKIADIVIDATLSETIQYDSTITEHPIETKTAVSDHIFKQPLKLKIEGYLTDSPMKVMGLFETPLQKNSCSNMSNSIKKMLPFLSSDKPSMQGYIALKALYNDRNLISVVTKLDAFHNMAITNLSFTSNDQTRGKLEFAAELVQVVHARVESTNVAISNKALQRLTSEPLDKGNTKLKAYTTKSYTAHIVDAGSAGYSWAKEGISNLFGSLFGGK